MTRTAASSRVISGRHVPGNPTIVPQNMPGAGSMKVAGYIYSVAPKDGSVFGIFATAAALEPLYTGNTTLFDPAKFTWIGNLDETIGTCAVWHTAGVSKLEDMRTKEVIFGGSGPAAINSQHAAALKNLLGLKIKIIQGYNGALETRLVMPRGELQGGCGFALSSLQAQHTADYRDGRLKPIVQLAIEKHPELEGVTHVYDYAKDDADAAGVRPRFRQPRARPALRRAAEHSRGPQENPARTRSWRRPTIPSFSPKRTRRTCPSRRATAKVEQLFQRFLSSSPEVVAIASKAIRD